MPLQDLTPQLRTRLRRVEKLVGLFVTIATLLLLSGFAYYLYHTAARKGWFVPRALYHTYVFSAEGLAEGDPVIMMGFSVGEIVNIEAQPPESYYPVFVQFEIRKPYYGYIWADSKLKIAAADFLGRRQIEITKGYAGMPTIQEKEGRVTGLLVKDAYVPPEKLLTGIYMAPAEEPALTERAEKLVAQVEAALPNILSLTNQLASTLGNVANLTSNAASLTANANTLVADAHPIVTNIVAITDNLKNPKGSLGEWVIPSDLNKQLNTTVGSANMTVTNMNAQITVLLANLNLSLVNLANITSNLNSQVQANDQILSELSSLVIETDTMLQGLKRHWLLKGAFPADPTKQPQQPILQPTVAP
jgi:ABC-type transporter Mla subunit MlaD